MFCVCIQTFTKLSISFREGWIVVKVKLIDCLFFCRLTFVSGLIQLKYCQIFL